MQQSYKTRLEYLERLRYEKEHAEELPHVFERKHYPWQTAFINSRAKNGFLTAANQCGKSVSLIEKNLIWATDKSLWPELWPSDPTQFWYLYPSLGTATREFDTKWVREILPRGEMMDDPIYGWKDFRKRGEIHKVVFQSGVEIYFKSYEQAVSDTQSSSVYLLSCDEELPEDYFDEVSARRNAINVNGYFYNVFTATLGQDFWRRTMEPEPGETELFPDATKWQISLYDCLYYDTGERSLWTEEEIQRRIQQCSTVAQEKKRIWGKFAVTSNLKYPSFERGKHYVKGHKLPRSWTIWSGVDIGSGAKPSQKSRTKAHPCGIAFVGVNKDFTAGRVFLTFRGDQVQTTAGQVLKKYQQLKGSMKPVGAFYDWQSADFKIIADSSGEPFQKAEKSQELGEDLLNTLFKNNMLKIYIDNKTDNIKLVVELETLKSGTPKSVAKDDLIDALRFAVTKIPWDFSKITTPYKKKYVDPYSDLSEREKVRMGLNNPRFDEENMDICEAEIDLANDVFDYDFNGIGDGDGYY